MEIKIGDIIKCSINKYIMEFIAIDPIKKGPLRYRTTFRVLEDPQNYWHLGAKDSNNNYIECFIVDLRLDPQFKVLSYYKSPLFKALNSFNKDSIR